MSEMQRTGQQLGRYRLTRLIGQGTLTQVYLAEDIGTRYQAAVKFFQVHMQPTSLRRFSSACASWCFWRSRIFSRSTTPEWMKRAPSPSPLWP